MTSPPPPVGCNNWDTTFSRVPPCTKEAYPMYKRPISSAKLRTVPRQFSWVDQRLVRERYIDQLSHEACTLYLFLVTVADAQKEIEGAGLMAELIDIAFTDQALI